MAKARLDLENRAKTLVETEQLHPGGTDKTVAATDVPAEPEVRPVKKGKVDAETSAAASAAATAIAAVAKPKPDDPADVFHQGYVAYLAGHVPEGIRMMERADAMGAKGARSRLCAIYRKPTAAEGKDFLKEANKCKGVD